MSRIAWALLAVCLANDGSGPARADEISKGPAEPQVSRERYERAERFLSWNVSDLTRNLTITPYWIDDHRFWYKRETEAGHEFVIIDAATRQRQAAFDHQKLAQALTPFSTDPIDPANLPFSTFSYEKGGKSVRVRVARNWLTCNLDTYACAPITTAPMGHEVLSPDGRWAAFTREHNLWIRNTQTGEERALTQEGGEYYAFAKAPDGNGGTVTRRLRNMRTPPVALWSPDSKRILTLRLDERKVRTLHLLQTTPPDGDPQARLHSFRLALPGDEHIPLTELYVIEIETGRAVRADLEPFFTDSWQTLIEDQSAWWSRDGERVYFIEPSRAYKSVTLKVMDARTGAVRSLIHEQSRTYVEMNLITWYGPNVKVIGGGEEIIWFSERDGWAHLYLYDGQGALKNRITSGPWVVRDIVAVDEKTRTLYFTASGRESGEDPYFRHLYSIKLDGTELTLLTPESAEHSIRRHPSQWSRQQRGLSPSPFGLSPGLDYIIDSYSTITRPARVVLRDINGAILMEIEHTDISALEDYGWTPPMPFSAKAADGVTDIYGALYFPSDFDPMGSYPVIDAIYPGPIPIQTPKAFSGSLTYGYNLQALAELGFIVATIDGRGTTLRSKAFHDASYGKMETAGFLIDHIAALRQLAQRHPYLDLQRVGIYGHSGGGYAATRAILEFPDFFKVAVASAGNQTQLGYDFAWGEKYQGLKSGDNYALQANAPLAKNLKGKLFLAHGGMDDNVPPALTLQVVDALIKANKDFDLLIMPNGNHRISDDPYFIRRRMDYFVRHLLGAAPPAGIRFKAPPPGRGRYGG